MLNPLAPLVLTVLVGSGATDTTVAVKAGTKLELECFSGDIQVRAWPKDAVRVTASHSRRATVVVRRDDGRRRINTETLHGIPVNVDYVITVPTWMALELAGVSTDISVEGVKGQIKASSVNGRVGVKGGGDFVVVESVEGGVQVVGARGRIEASSINDDVEIADSEGEITAESVEGNILLDGVDSRTVEVSSVNGSLFFSGPFKSGGVYSLSTHDGDVIVGVPERPDVAVTVATFEGDFSASFPVKLSESRHRRRHEFVLGSGAARLEVDAFQGHIRLEQENAALKAALERMREGRQAMEDAQRMRRELRWKVRHATPPAAPTPPPAPDPESKPNRQDPEDQEAPR